MVKNLKFELIEKKAKTNIWQVSSKGDDCLGYIFWYSQWRRYVFQPIVEMKCIWDCDCLLELADFIRGRMEAGRKE